MSNFHEEADQLAAQIEDAIDQTSRFINGLPEFQPRTQILGKQARELNDGR